MTLRPWILQGGRKARTMDGKAILCEECPCGCDTCDALALNPPDGYTRGWRFEVAGVPCGSPCYAPAQTFTLDYTDYHDTHPLWETCAWYERDETCIRWYAITPDCRLTNWANIRMCDSSSSSSSSSSPPVGGWYCQLIRHVWQAGSLDLQDQPCGLTPTDIMSLHSLGELMDLCIQGRGREEYTYNAYQLDADGNLIYGEIITGTEWGRYDAAKIWPWNQGCYNAQGEITYGDDCDHCVWGVGLDTYGDFNVRMVVSTVRVESQAQCGEGAFHSASLAPQEDDLI